MMPGSFRVVGGGLIPEWQTNKVLEIRWADIGLDSKLLVCGFESDCDCDSYYCLLCKRAFLNSFFVRTGIDPQLDGEFGCLCLVDAHTRTGFDTGHCPFG